MSYLFKVMVLILAFTAIVTGCAKKSKKSHVATATAAAPPADSSANDAPPYRGGTTADAAEDAGSDEDRFRLDNSNPSRFNESISEEDDQRFNNTRFTPAVLPPSSREGEEGFGGEEEELPRTAGAPTGDPEGSRAQSVDLGPSDDRRCATAVGHDSEQWAPGLPNPPSQVKICTGGIFGKKLQPGETFQCEGNPDPVYTDARQDGLMAFAVNLVNRLPRHMDHGSRDLAQRISGVKARVGRGVKVQLNLQLAQDHNAEINFSGAIPSSGGGGIQLRALNSPRNLKFSAVLACLDANGGCQNAILRVQQLSLRGKVGRIAYVVLRSGEAHVTMSEQDRTGFRSLQNKNHERFAQYLSNTSYNTCVSILRQTVNGERQLPTCAYRRLKMICGRQAKYKYPAAQAFEFNSWAVAYGKAGLDFEMIDTEKVQFRIEGPLVTGPNTPVLKKEWPVTGGFGSSIKYGLLIANDGGGNLNFQVDFVGDTRTRFSVTTLIEDVRYNAEALIVRARQMPALGAQDMIDERDQQQDESNPRDEGHQRRGNVQSPTRVQPRAFSSPPAEAARPSVPRRKSGAAPGSSRVAKSAKASPVAPGSATSQKPSKASGAPKPSSSPKAPESSKPPQASEPPKASAAPPAPEPPKAPTAPPAPEPPKSPTAPQGPPKPPAAPSPSTKPGSSIINKIPTRPLPEVDAQAGGAQGQKSKGVQPVGPREQEDDGVVQPTE